MCVTVPQSFQMFRFFYSLNLDEWGADFAPTMREALKCWNMTVQHWLGKFNLEKWGADFAYVHARGAQVLEYDRAALAGQV